MSAIKDGRLPIVLDKERHLLFSLNVIDEMQDKFGGFDKLAEMLKGKDGIKNLRWLLTLVNRIQEKAVDIYEMTLEANELDLRQADEHRQRQRLQAKALTYCKELLFFIELSQEMGFISMKSCEYWSKLALEVKYMIAAWKKRDKARA